MATITTLPVAWRGKRPERRSTNRFLSAAGTPISSMATRAHTTKRCGEILFSPLTGYPPPRKSALQRRPTSWVCGHCHCHCHCHCRGDGYVEIVEGLRQGEE